MYVGEFTCWKDVSDAYKGDRSSWTDSDKVPDIPEPQEVVYAYYDSHGYDGTSSVIYREGELYYVVNGSHCSCYGLEGQWQPEEYELSLLVAAIQKADSWLGEDHSPKILAKLMPRIVGKVRPLKPIADKVIGLAKMSASMVHDDEERRKCFDFISIIETHFSI